jgi:Leucine-rich repeat (LRR) protein
MPSFHSQSQHHHNYSQQNESVSVKHPSSFVPFRQGSFSPSSSSSSSSSHYLNYTNHQLTPQIIQSTILSSCSSYEKIFPHLTTLLFSFNQIGDEGVIILLEHITNSCSSLITLDLGFNGISDLGVEFLVKQLIDHPSLQILYLSGNEITDLGCSLLALLLQENHILTKLYLAGNTRITSPGAEVLSQAILSNTSLIALDLNSTMIQSAGFSSISSSLENEFMNLSELYLVRSSERFL